MPYKITCDCINCTGCRVICPQNAIYSDDERSYIDSSRCDDCGICVKEYSCPAEAIVRDEKSPG